MFESEKFNDLCFGLKIFKDEVTTSHCDQNQKRIIDKTVAITGNESVEIDIFINSIFDQVTYYDVKIAVNGIYGNKDEISASIIKAYINMNYQLNLTDTSAVDNRTIPVKNKFRAKFGFIFCCYGQHKPRNIASL